MKKLWNIAKLMLLLASIAGLYAFSVGRNDARKTGALKITFVGETRPFITENNVDKLLIQNRSEIANLKKETLALNTFETLLQGEDIIEEADVFRNIQGNLTAKIRQRTPIARIMSNSGFYLDTKGIPVALSGTYTARVPLAYNIKSEDVPVVYPLLLKIHKDEFLKYNITTIEKVRHNMYHLSMRGYDFKVEFGDLQHQNKKIQNFKSFYQKAIRDNRLSGYSKVNLSFENQVVCTRKTVNK